jgi:tetratricopeptide (TPR) repeat protein
VSWISGGSYVFSTFFFLAALCCYVKSDRSLFWLIPAVGFFGLCAFSGNTAAALPAMFLAYDFLLPQRAPANLRRLRLGISAAVAIAAIIFAANFWAGRTSFARSIFFFRGPSYLVVIAKAFVYYLKILYLPIARGLYHPFAYNTTDTNKFSPAFFISLAIIALAVYVFWRSRKRAKPLAFGLSWFFIAYLPYSNLIPVCNIISERYMYLPSAGIALILAYLFLRAWELVNRESRRYLFRRAAVAALALFIGSYAVLTIKHNSEYANLLTYWQTNIRNFPDGYMAYNNLAGTYYALGNKEQAIAYCWVNLMINPQQPHVWCNLAKVYRETGNLEMARFCYEEALKVGPNFLPATQGLEALKKSDQQKR